jgi:hypothetical protein
VASPKRFSVAAYAEFKNRLFPRALEFGLNLKNSPVSQPVFKVFGNKHP